MTAITGSAPQAPAGVGLGTGEADLWCTYAAIRTLRWLDRLDSVQDPTGTASCLQARRNTDGGYAWTRGMTSDAWATFYCTQALRDLGEPVETTRTAQWLSRTWTGSAYGMQPGQSADVWATHFSVRTQVEVCGLPVPDPDALRAWLAHLQHPDGGLTWSPGHARSGRPDVRACYYGVLAWQESRVGGPPPWDHSRLSAWLRARQDGSGGFKLDDTAATPCLWATYRAVGALHALGTTPRDVDGCRRWITEMRAGDGYVRWPGYDQEDVWASFCAVGSLRALRGAANASQPRPGALSRRIATFAAPRGGYTYVPVSVAGDALTTSAAALGEASRRRRAELVRWLEGCLLPNENGIMYMPGRGSEVRCTLWALAAGAFASDPPTLALVGQWISQLQNPDGGVGYWEGRGSDMVSTVAAAEILQLAGIPVAAALDTTRLNAFVSSCEAPLGYANVPGGPVRLRPGLHAARVLATTQNAPTDTAELLDRHAVRSGGYADEGNRVPDLLSTYEAVVTADRFGIDVDTVGLQAVTERLRMQTGTRWSPLAPAGGGPLADCLVSLLDRRLTGRDSHPLPALTLS